MLIYKTLRFKAAPFDAGHLHAVGDWLDANGRKILCHEVGAQLGLDPAKTYEATITDDSGEIGRIDASENPGEFLFSFDMDWIGEIEGTSLDGANGAAEFDGVYNDVLDWLNPVTMYAVMIKEA